MVAVIDQGRTSTPLMDCHGQDSSSVGRTMFSLDGLPFLGRKRKRPSTPIIAGAGRRRPIGSTTNTSSSSSSNDVDVTSPDYKRPRYSPGALLQRQGQNTHDGYTSDTTTNNVALQNGILSELPQSPPCSVTEARQYFERVHLNEHQDNNRQRQSATRLQQLQQNVTPATSSSSHHYYDLNRQSLNGDILDDGRVDRIGSSGPRHINNNNHDDDGEPSSSNEVVRRGPQTDDESNGISPALITNNGQTPPSFALATNNPTRSSSTILLHDNEESSRDQSHPQNNEGHNPPNGTLYYNTIVDTPNSIHSSREHNVSIDRTYGATQAVSRQLCFQTRLSKFRRKVTLAWNAGIVPFLIYVLLPVLSVLIYCRFELETQSNILKKEQERSFYRLQQQWNTLSVQHSKLQSTYQTTKVQLGDVQDQYETLRKHVVLEIKPSYESCQEQSTSMQEELQQLSQQQVSSLNEVQSLEMTARQQQDELITLNQQLQQQYDACMDAMDAIALASAQKRIYDRKQLQEAHQRDLAAQADISARALNAIAMEAERKRQQDMKHMNDEMFRSAEQALDAINAVALSRAKKTIKENGLIS